MGLFNNNITNDIDYIKRGRIWMTLKIKEIVSTYVNQGYQTALNQWIPLWRNDEEITNHIRHQIIDVWTKNWDNIVENFGIYSTNTEVKISDDPKYKYVVDVQVAFQKYFHERDHIDFIHFPIIDQLEQDLINPDSELVRNHRQKALEYKPRII